MLRVAPLNNRGSIPAKGKRFFCLFPNVLTDLVLTQCPIQGVMGYVSPGGGEPPSFRLWFYDLHGEKYYLDIID